MRLIDLVIFLLSTFTIINSQPDSRFRPFDWVLYHGPGEIKSLSEGYNYLYIATKNGGIKRFNIYNLTFDEPITIAQGLESNNVSAIHFDSDIFGQRLQITFSIVFLERVIGFLSK